MKTIIAILLVIINSQGQAQNISLQMGKNLWPADHVGLRYEHWTNGGINFSGGLFHQRSHYKRLNYSCFGLDLLGEYISNRNADPLPWFGLRLGAGATWQVQQEPWLFQKLSFRERMNYGLLLEVNLDCNITEHFRLSLFGQQKYFFRKQMGSNAFCFGLGLAYRLSAY